MIVSFFLFTGVSFIRTLSRATLQKKSLFSFNMFPNLVILLLGQVVYSFKDRSVGSVNAKRQKTVFKKISSLGPEISEHVKMVVNHIEDKASFQDGTCASCPKPDFSFFANWKNPFVKGLNPLVTEVSEHLLGTPDYPNDIEVDLLKQNLLPLAGRVKNYICEFLNLPLALSKDSNVEFTILSKLAEHFGILDTEFVQNLNQGAALGIENTVEEVPIGLWPERDYRAKDLEPPSPILAKGLSYSAISNFEKLSEILNKEMALGWIIPYSEDLAKARVTLHLLEKMRSDSSIKHRLISDFSRNGVNRLSILKWSITLVRLVDVRSVIHEAFKKTCTVFFGELDVESAFRLISVRKPEERYLYFNADDGKNKVEGTYVRLPFGLRVSPFIFTRFFSVFGRLMKVLLRGSGSSILVYVDDILFISAASIEEALFAFSLTVILALALNIPWSFSKLRKPGVNASFIGFKLISSKNLVKINANPDSLKIVRNFMSTCLTTGKVEVKSLHSMVGKLVFLTSGNPLLRKFLSPFYAFLSEAEKKGLSKPMIGKKNIYKAMKLWLVFLDHPEKFSLEISKAKKWVAGSDASTITVAAWSVDPENLASFRWARISVSFLFEKLPFLRGNGRVCGDMAVLELVGVALATFISPSNTSLKAISDSSSAVGVLGSKKSLSERMSRILHQCGWNVFNMDVAHLAGSENWLADRLSRDQSFKPPFERNINMELFCDYLCK